MSHKINNPLIRKVISKIYYFIHKKDRKFLLELLPRNSIGVEIGVFQGDFSKEILEVVNPRKLFLIDIWDYDRQNHSVNFECDLSKGQLTKYLEKVRNKYQNDDRVDIRKGLSQNILSMFKDGFFDWIYIDGDHRYEGVKKDLELAYDKVKEDGIIAGDDYIEKEGWGVVKAVNEIIKEKNLKLVLVKNYQYMLERQKSKGVNHE